MTAWITVALLLVGLPLLFWWLGSRRMWDRMRGRTADRDPWGEWMRRHGLSVGESVRVARAVPRGEALDEPPLRAAAVDWARIQLRPVGPRDPRRRRLLIAASAAYLLALVGVLGHRVGTGHPEDVNWVAVVAWTAFGVWAVRRRRNIRRALELNADGRVQPEDAS